MNKRLKKIEANLTAMEAEYEPKLPGGTPVADLLAKTPDLPKDVTFASVMSGSKDEVNAKLLKDSDKGLRASTGKIRYDLLEPFAIEQVARIFTKGAAKYADHNWLKGMKWSKMIASAKRHIAAFEKGEDYDFDPNCKGCQEGNCLMHTGELHVAQAAWNMLGLTSYYKHYPQGDDRLNIMLPKPKIGLDIDGVICDWFKPWCEKFGYNEPHTWDFSYRNKEHFFEDMNQEQLNDFYKNLSRLVNPDDLNFEPHCYITARSVPIELTKTWLQANGFPTKPVYSVGFGESKVEVAKNQV